MNTLWCLYADAKNDGCRWFFDPESHTESPIVALRWHLQRRHGRSEESLVSKWEENDD